jgi:hypothetical protein
MVVRMRTLTRITISPNGTDNSPREEKRVRSPARIQTINNEDEMRATLQGQFKIDSTVGKAGYTAFSKVASLTLSEESRASRPSYSLLLILETDRPDENYRLRMGFTGVKNLSLREFGGWPTQITGFDVVDVSEKQIEGIRFEVKDYENGVIRFACETAEVQEVEKIG